MRVRRPVTLVALTAFLASAGPSQPPSPPSGRIAPPRPDSPVRCRLGEGDRPRPMLRVGALRGSAPAPVAPTSPPLPPPPAPLVAHRAPAQQIVSTAQRAGDSAGTVMRKMATPYGSPQNTDRYDGKAVASIQSTAQTPVSTFSVDVDTGSYANVRRILTQGSPVPPEAVRTEEMINYFRYDYPRPTDRTVPFSITTDVARAPWNADTRLLRIGLRGYDIDTATRPPANLVFLVDTSGSMQDADKLPLLKSALKGLAGNLRPDDRVSIVAYAGSAGVVLDSTADKGSVIAALDCLEAGGSTAGGAGITLAYDIARAQFRKGGVNRIFLATDGDFNVGLSDNKALEEMVKRNRDDGITLTTLGFGQGNYNEAMMERIADVGNGNYAYIDSALEARKVLDDELSATLVTIAKDVKVQVELNPAAIREYRLVGYENRALAEEDFTNDAVDAGDMGAGHQVTALYEVVPAGAKGWTPDRRYTANRPAPGKPGPAGEAAYVKLRFKLPDGKTSHEISRPVPVAALTSATAPRGDMAFATAVAAFGQKLRGDTYLGNYGFADIRSLAGEARGYSREEFVKLVQLAGTPG
ncbi:VWA domain-containing protein [soil metagenome]